MTSDPCAAPRCAGEPVALVTVGPLPEPCYGHLPDDPLDHCARLWVCVDHVTPFVDRAHVYVADFLVPCRLTWAGAR